MKILLPKSIQCFTPLFIHKKLRLDVFRGEPAISKFVWHITSNHKSSEPFATDTGSGLHQNLIWLHPAHG